MKKMIFTPNAGAPVAFYSQGIVVNDFLYISGQIGLDANTNRLIQNTFADEFKQVLKNVTEIIKESGFELSNIIKIEAFLTDSDYLKEFNEIYTEYFSFMEIKPVRQTVIVKALPREARVEISAICYKENSN